MEHPQANQFAEPTGDLGGIDADALLEQVESGGHSEIPMSAQEASPAAAAPEQAAAPAGVQEVEFTWNGKQVKAPLEKAKQWASQGYDYAQRMQEFNANREKFEAEQKALQEKYGHYSAIDEFARNNPDWWNHVSQSWEQRAAAAMQGAQAVAQQQGGIDPNHPVVQELSALKSELSQIKDFKTSLEQERQNQQREQEDKAIADEIASIRNTYPDLDLSRVDESGKTLEMRVLEHAIANNIRSFKTAFHDFNHERLMQLAEERGKQAAQKERQKQTKLGLLGKTQAPVKGISESHNIKTKNYDDLYSEALAEMGITG